MKFENISAADQNKISFKKYYPNFKYINLICLCFTRMYPKLKIIIYIYLNDPSFILKKVIRVWEGIKQNFSILGTITNFMLKPQILKIIC